MEKERHMFMLEKVRAEKDQPDNWVNIFITPLSSTHSVITMAYGVVLKKGNIPLGAISSVWANKFVQKELKRIIAQRKKLGYNPVK